MEGILSYNNNNNNNNNDNNNTFYVKVPCSAVKYTVDKYTSIIQTLKRNNKSPLEEAITFHFDIVHSAFFLLKGYLVEMEVSQRSPPSFTSKCPLTSKSGLQQCPGPPERQTLLRTAESHGLQLLAVLRSFRECGLMFDFTINVAGHTFPCHRCVLAASSDFFRYSASSYR